jgi:hypothetical protein
MLQAGRWLVDSIKLDLTETERDGMDWIDLAQDMDQWRALVYTVMNLLLPYNTGSSWVASHEGLSSMMLVSYLVS